MGVSGVKGGEDPGAARRTAHFETLSDRLRMPNCPICRIGQEQERRFLETLSYERVNEPEFRRELTEARGFCEGHGALLADFGDPLGNSILQEDLLGALDADLALAAEAHRHRFLDETPLGRFRDAEGTLPVRGECPVCRSKSGRERDYVEFLLEHVRDAELASLYARSSGLCRPHLALASRLARTSKARFEGFRTMVGLERTILASLTAELKEIQRRSDYRFSGGPPGPEKDAWVRAIRKTSGYVRP